MFRLDIDTGNAAFEDDAGPELARILGKLVDTLSQADMTDANGGGMYDVNGNRVGQWIYNPEGCTDDR